jgi:hypothetical protein
MWTEARTMIVDIPGDADDDVAFLSNMSGLLARLIAERTPEIVCAVRIDKWFDHKWLRYSGQGRIGFEGVGLSHDTALDAFWQEKLTFPAFNPKQVALQVGWQRTSAGTYEALRSDKLPHKKDRRHSAANLQNRVASYTDSGVFMWFSGRSKSNGKACVMVYGVQGSAEESWYASFDGARRWVVDRARGIDRETLRGWFPLG